MTSQELKSLRLSLKLSQAQLADKLGVTARAVSFWETGKRKIPNPIILLMALMKGIDIFSEKGENS